MGAPVRRRVLFSRPHPTPFPQRAPCRIGLRVGSFAASSLPPSPRLKPAVERRLLRGPPSTQQTDAPALRRLRVLHSLGGHQWENGLRKPPRHLTPSHLVRTVIRDDRFTAGRGAGRAKADAPGDQGPGPLQVGPYPGTARLPYRPVRTARSARGRQGVGAGGCAPALPRVHAGRDAPGPMSASPRRGLATAERSCFLHVPQRGGARTSVTMPLPIGKIGKVRV